MEMNEEDKKKQMEFVMKVGYQMRTFLNSCLIDAFKTHNERSAAFYSTLINFIANTIVDVSAPDRVKDNILEIIEGLQDWVDGKDILIVKYDPNTKTINKEEMH